MLNQILIFFVYLYLQHFFIDHIIIWIVNGVNRHFASSKDRCYDFKHEIRLIFLPSTSEAGVRFPARPQVGKLVVACRWSAVYSTEP